MAGNENRQPISSSHMNNELSETATLTDLSLLDCPICLEPLISTVFQCENGHIACAPCCTRIKNKCPSCRCPVGTNRCRALEKVLESVTVKCGNTVYGCTDTFKLKEKLHHEKEVCLYKPSTCPYRNCNYIGMWESLYKHFGETHSPSTISFNTMKSFILYPYQTPYFLQDSNKSTLFIIERVIKPLGTFLSVTCVGPDSMRGDFSYHLTAAIDWDTHLKIEAGVVCVPKWTPESALGKCLILPTEFVDVRSKNQFDYRWGRLALKLIIRRNAVAPVDASGG